MKQIVRFIGLLALVLLLAVPSMALAKEKIEVGNNERRDFNNAIKAQNIYVLPADLEKKLLAVANEQMKFKVDRVFFDVSLLGKQWEIFKSTKWPYNVTSRSRVAYLVTEQDGKIIRTLWMVIQDVDPVNAQKWSNTYRFQAPMTVMPPAYVDNYAPNKLTNKYVEGKTP